MKKLLVLFLVIALLSVGCATAGPSGGGDAEPATTGSAPETAPPTAPKTEPVPTTAAPTTETPAPETEPAQTAEAPETEPAQTTEAPEPVNPWSLLGSSGYVAGSYTDEWDNEYDYSYDLPVLLADTEGALEINKALDERFGSTVREEQANMEQKLSLGFSDIGFHGVVWEDVLTVVVIAHGYFDGWTDYGVYCYEVSSGRRLTTPMILERMGLSEEDFLEDCRNLFQNRFVENYSGLSEENRAQAGYNDTLARQTTDEFVNLDLAVYPAEGDLMVVAPILSLAGPDYFYEVLPLGLNAVG